jgi:hypothetical protein
MPKMSPDRKERMLAETEEAMLKLRVPYRVHEHIGRKWSIEKRQVQRLVAEVERRWRERSKSLDKIEMRELRRDRQRETLDMMIQDALMNQVPVKNEDGSVVLDDREFITDRETGGQVANPNWKKPFMRPAPDRRSALYALRLLANLDALNEPIKATLDIPQLGDQLPDLDSLPDDAHKKLVQALEAMAPDGDLRKLAGELFSGSARRARLN